MVVEEAALKKKTDSPVLLSVASVEQEKPIENSLFSKLKRVSKFTEVESVRSQFSSIGLFQEEEVKEDSVDDFEVFERWLRENGAEFPSLCLKSYSRDVRGVHAKTFIEGYKTVLSVPLKCLITDFMGRTETDFGRRVFSSDAKLSTPNLIAVVLYILSTRQLKDHFFQPYYRILPKSYSSFPIFWSKEELSYLKGSPLLRDIEERKKNMQSDYEEIKRVCPDFSFSFSEFLEVRTAVGSRNFGIVVNGEKRTAMVPFADMLNHFRPRETSWTYENAKGAFTITSISPILPGQQVMDSYGKKCNSKFFLHYGFAVERNREEDGKCQNEILLKLSIKSPVFSQLQRRKRSHSSADSEELERKSRVLGEHELFEEKMALLSSVFNLNFHRGLFISRGFRLSMNFEDKSTAEALSFLRVKAASSRELAELREEQESNVKHLQRLYFSRSREVSVSPLSAALEAKSLRLLAESCREQLRKYEFSYEHNLDLSLSEAFPEFSNRKTALTVVLGEQEICRFWVYVSEVLCPILEEKDFVVVKQRLSSLPCVYDREKDLFRFASFLTERLLR